MMLERVGILVVFAFLLSRMKSFRDMIHYKHGYIDKAWMIVIFGMFGIISNYIGIQIQGDAVHSQTWHFDLNDESAIANTRILGVVIGGLLGGPVVGTGVGIIAGVHRFTLGGFSSIACGISAAIAGVLSGLVGKRYRYLGSSALLFSAIFGILMEALQMGIILFVAKPFLQALTLVKVISLPMILMNGIGIFLFMLIIQTIFQEEERARALETHKALFIADQTLPFFRKGLNAHSSKEAAEIILKWTNADAVSITNEQQILAHAGVGADHHIPLQSLATKLTHTVLECGHIIKAKSQDEIQCSHQNCPLKAALVMPLKIHFHTVGTLKLYFTDPKKLDQVEEQLGEGLGKLFSTQLELGEAELQSKLLKDAEIKALQAQIHPHFLFNAINTISALCRTDSEKARRLLLKLSVFFRSNLQGARHILIPLQKELEHVEAYLSLEQARFPNKYKVCLSIEPLLEQVLIPPFTLQPLVENAIRHSFSKPFDKKNGIVTVRAFKENDRVVLMAEDNGKGISSELVDSLGKQAVTSIEGTGTALYNIKKRMSEIYGEEASFQIESQLGSGTKVIIQLPLNHISWGEQHDQSVCSR